MISRNIMTNLLSLQDNLRPKCPKRETVKERDNAVKVFVSNKVINNVSIKNTIRPLPPFHGGEKVRRKLDKEKTWEKQGTIKVASPDIRSYMVETPSRTYERNRKHLKPVTTQSTPPSTETNIPDDTGVKEQPTSPNKETTNTVVPTTPKVGPDTLTTKSGRVIRRPSVRTNTVA